MLDDLDSSNEVVTAEFDARCVVKIGADEMCADREAIGFSAVDAGQISEARVAKTLKPRASATAEIKHAGVTRDARQGLHTRQEPRVQTRRGQLRETQCVIAQLLKMKTTKPNIRVSISCSDRTLRCCQILPTPWI